MMPFFKIICIALFLSLICSCEKDGLPDEGFYTIPEKHLAWFPYEDDAVLIFKDENEISTSYLGSKVSQNFNPNGYNSESEPYFTQSYSTSFNSYANYLIANLEAPSPTEGTELYLRFPRGSILYDLDKNQVIEPGYQPGLASLTKTQCEILSSYNTGVKTYTDVLHCTVDYIDDSTQTVLYYAKNKGYIQYTTSDGTTSTLQE